MAWNISVKNMTGQLIIVQLANGAEAIVLDLKKGVNDAKDGSLPPHQQRLTFQGLDGAKRLEDEKKLSSYAGIGSGSVVLLLVLPPFELYVRGADGRMHTITVPSSEPERYEVASLQELVRDKVHRNFSDYQLQFQNKALHAVRHGRRLTLRDYRIKSGETLFIMKHGFTLDITNPKVDVCFMVDCTSSMRSYIEAVKNNVKQLRDDLVREYRGCDIRFAFVRYTDYDLGSNRTTWMDFTTNQSAFHTFVSGITAQGGGDAPEDVMGGLQAVFSNLSWRSGGSRVLVHIADAPCHGKKYHTGGDSYPNGDRDGISHEQMMAKVQDYDVQYWFGYINRSYTDQMIEVFNECLQRISDQRLLIRQFDAMQPSEVGASVHRSVSASIYGSESAKKARVRKYKLDPAIPDWGSSSIFEQYGKKTPAPGIKSMQDLQQELTLDPPSIPITVKCAPNPFAEGEECLVYHASDLTTKKAVVLKKYKREGLDHDSLECYMRELEIRTICSTYAREFNADKAKPPGSTRLDFQPVDIVECPGPEYYMLESFLSGKIEKYSNNAGVVSSKSGLSELMQAFSHYSWVHSGKSLLICDLQGVESGSRVTLTDPAIHSTSACSYGHTDLGQAGIDRFFKTHTCGQFCQSMGLSGQLPSNY